MAVATTGQFAGEVTPGLRKVFFDQLGKIPKEWRRLFPVVNGIPRSQAGGPAGGAYFDDHQISSLSNLAGKTQGAAVQYQLPVEGGDVRYTPYVFAGGFRMTMEMKDDDLYGVFAKMSRELAGAAAYCMEVQAFRILNGGFVTTSGTGHNGVGFDGKALFATDHTILNPMTTATRSNTLSAAADLSQTSIEELLTNAENWVNNSGFPTPARLHTLVYGPANSFIAKELTDSELKPWTADNEVNAIKGELDRMLVHYLDDPDSFFLLGDKESMDSYVWVRKGSTFDVGDDFDTDDSKAKVMIRVATGHSEPDGLFGAAGV